MMCLCWRDISPNVDAGDMQFLMDIEGDLCPTEHFHSMMTKPGSSGSLTDDSNDMFPATPPQKLLHGQ